MNISRGPYSANVDPVHIAGKRQIEYQVVVSRYGMPAYEQSEDNFEEAMRIAMAHIDWGFDNHTDT